MPALDGEVEDYMFLLNDYITLTSDTIEDGSDTCRSALSTITVPEPGGKFLVESGATLELTAGTSITLKPSFIAEKGSYGLFKITDSHCNVFLAPKVEEVKEDIVTNEKTGETYVVLYPNPTTGLVHVSVKFNNNEGYIDVEVYNMIGKLLESNSVQYSSSFNIDFSQYEKGFYIVKPLHNGQQYVHKLIKQ